MADVSLTIALAGLEAVKSGISGLTTSVGDIGARFQSTSQKLTDTGERLGMVGAKMALITAPAALLGKSILESGADFESAMNKLSVTADGAAGHMTEISAKAKEIGANTTFSAGEAADALIALSKNGITVGEALGGVLDATVNLAAATGTGLSQSADIAAKAMGMFGASAADLPEMMNEMFNAAQSSTLELPQLADALAQGGTAAHTAGISFTDTMTALTTMSSAFASGSDAGTSFKTALVALAAPTTKQAEEAEKLGINVRDATGNFLPMRDIIGQLTTAFQGMGTAQKEQAASDLVGQDAFRALISLADQGVGAWDKNRAAIERQGTSSAAAKVMMEGLHGAMDQLWGAVQLVGISLYESGFIAWVTSAVNKVADFITWVSKLPTPALDFVAALTAISVAAGPVLLAIAGISTVLGALLTPVGLAVAAVVGIGAALTAGVVLWQRYGDGIKATLIGTVDSATAWAGRMYDEIVGGIQGVYTGAVSTARELQDQIVAALKGIVDAAVAFARSVYDEIVGGLQGVYTGAVGAVRELADQIIAAFKSIVGAASTFAGDFRDSVVGGVTSAVEDGVAEIKSLRDGILGYFKSVPSSLASMGKGIEDALITPYQGAADEIVGHSIYPDMIDSIIDETKRFTPATRTELTQTTQQWQTFGDRSGAAVSQSIDGMLADMREFPIDVAPPLDQATSHWQTFAETSEGFVTGFASDAQNSLSTFFQTGELDAAGFGQALIGTFADVAAEATVNFVAMTVKAVLFGHATFLAAIEGALGLDTATVSAVALDFALSPILIVVLLIAAALGLLYLAGVDIGDIFSWIADIIGAVLKGAFQAFMAVISALVGIFSTLIDLMSTFVGWIQTIGDELGKGDLKDLLDIFGGGNLFSGIGDIFGGIGNFFGGLFAEGGWVGSGSADGAAIPIIAHDGEFVVNRDSSARYGKLLEAINSGGSMHEAVQAIDPGAGLVTVNQYGSAAMSGGGGGGGDTNVHVHGSVVSDSLSTSQIGRKLGRAVRSEDRRLRGRLS